MRADAHYVDLLSARSTARREQMLEPRSIDAPGLSDVADGPLLDSIRRHGIVQPLLVQQRNGRYRLIAGKRRLAAAITAGLRTIPCLVLDVDDDEARQLGEASNVSQPVASPHKSPTADLSRASGAALARSLETVTSCAGVLAGALSGVSRTVITDLVNAEAWRASCMLQATRVIRQELPYAKTETPVSSIIDRVVQSFAPERRLHLVGFDVKIDSGSGLGVLGDPHLLVGAISGAVIATLALLEGARGAHLTIAAAVDSTQAIAFTVSQTSVAAPEEWVERALDPAWLDRPGGVPAAVLMAALRMTAEAHGGSALVVPADRGTTITITVPRHS
jgi:ParB/RepB/Spo0J family partition protein